jgi:HEAT repeats
MLEVVIYVSAVLLGLIVILMVAIVVRRLRNDRDRRHYRAKSDVWEPLFFAYLEGDDTEASIAATLNSKADFDAFIEFSTFYLKNITGDEVHAIANLSMYTGITARLHSDLRGGRRKKHRAVAAITLGLLEDMDVLPYLEKMLEDDDPYLVYAGAYGIACLREYGLFMLVMRTLLARTPITYEGTSELLVRFGENICPTLDGILRAAVIEHERGESEFIPETQPDNRLQVDLDNFIEVSLLLDILGNFRYGEAGELMFDVMEAAGNEEVTIHAIKALIRMKPPGAAARIVPLLEHPNWVIRSQAARALGALGERGYQRELVAHLNDEQWWVRHYAAQALQAMA